MLKLVASDKKSKVSIHDRQVLGAVAEAIARTRHADITAKECRSDAKTVLSAWVLRQSAETAARRLLAWWCVDCGIKNVYLENASADTVARVKATANAGYAILEAVEKYGTSFLNEKPRNESASPIVP